MCAFACSSQRRHLAVLTNTIVFEPDCYPGWPELEQQCGMLKYLGPLPKTYPCRNKHPPLARSADNRKKFWRRILSSGPVVLKERNRLTSTGRDVRCVTSPPFTPWPSLATDASSWSLCCGKTNTSRDTCCVSTLPHPLSIREFATMQPDFCPQLLSNACGLSQALAWCVTAHRIMRATLIR